MKEALQAAAQHLILTAGTTPYTVTTPAAGDTPSNSRAPENTNRPETVPDSPAHPATETGTGAGRTAAARVLAALKNGPLDKTQVIETLAADGGRELSISRINTVLSELCKTGRIHSPERGRYQLP
ncbi:hypothetical protein [Streptomyces hoynatensis]|uniref:Uncharacterized protein n=1 Tax=Streptomyces hoynatensis TaxID=1141874 RepID=A0A3A9YI34_9ACTN|nr:hypothetical protein [Streptomyces hoynatensis]RKN36681.1 hypothetical protein D7294_29840 [Streptomyces hoynatensis]